MLKKYLRPVHISILIALVIASQSLLAQESNKVDTLNISTASQANTKDANRIPEKQKNIIFKNSLTDRVITIDKGRSSFKFKYGARVQTRFDLSRDQEQDANSESKLYFRRVRVKSDGHLFTPKLGYKLEIDIIGAQILDAVIKWNFYQNFVLWAGQTKLRGNRERVISSQNLQFVDRSLLNSKFTLDRDIGFWLMHHFNAGEGVIREAISVSKGEGRSIFEDNPMTIERGLDYTARIEYLPFGKFTNKGDYKGSDLEREQKPKLSIGLTFDFNENAVKTNGQKGSVTDNTANLRSWIGDLMFKYNGFSVMAEYVDRKVYNFHDQTILEYNDYVNDFYTGTALNVQSGYLLQRNYEVAARYSQVRPQEGSFYKDLSEYTIVLSKFIVGHKIKVQTDFSILKEIDKPITNIYRLQFEFSF